MKKGLFLSIFLLSSVPLFSQQSVKSIIVVGFHSAKQEEKGWDAYCWKNGSFIELGPGQAHSITMHKGDAYITGYSDRTDPRRFGYWKNADFIEEKMQVISIFSHGNDLYLLGYDKEKNAYRFKKNGDIAEITGFQYPYRLFMKNGSTGVIGHALSCVAGNCKDLLRIVHGGTTTDLSATEGRNEPGLFVEGNDMYIAGMGIGTAKKGELPVLRGFWWKNGEYHFMEERNHYPRYIFASGKDLFIGFYEAPYYLHNGNKIILESGNITEWSETGKWSSRKNTASLLAMCLSGKDVYAAGSYRYMKKGAESSKFVVWKNGKIYQTVKALGPADDNYFFHIQGMAVAGE